MQKLPVTILSGFLGAGKTSTLNHILTHQQEYRVAVIVNDMGAINIDAHMLQNGSARLNCLQEHLVEMNNGCICCTLREDLLAEIGNLARKREFDYLLIEATGIAEPLPIAVTFGLTDEMGSILADIAQLDTMVTVIDASTFMKYYQMTYELWEHEIGIDQNDTRTLGNLLVEQVEFSNVLLINKIDLVDEQQLGQLEALLHHLNPGARLVRTHFGGVSPNKVLHTRLFDLESSRLLPGWAQELLGHHIPEIEQYDISSFVYTRYRPFHPERFWNLLHNPVHNILRSKGFFWLATRMQYIGVLSQVGPAFQVEPGGVWWVAQLSHQWQEDEEMRLVLEQHWHADYGDRRQELVFIGMHLKQTQLIAALDACLLSDAEMAAGVATWSQFVDPFPLWYGLETGYSSHAA